MSRRRAPLRPPRRPRHPVGRRAFLRAGAGCCLALPLFEALQPRTASARDGELEHFVAMVSSTTIHTPMYLPYSDGREPWPVQQVPRRPFYSGEGPMDAPIGGLSEVNESLAPHVGELLFVEGLHGGHSRETIGPGSIGHDGYSRLLLGTPGREGFAYGGDEHVSLDQRIAAHVGQDTRFAALQLGTGAKGSGNQTAISWTGPDQAAPAVSDSVEIWNRLFADFDADPEVAMRLREEKRSVLDAALEQASSLESRLSQADRAKLDLYLTSFREVESRLDNFVGACTVPPTPAAPESDGVEAWPMQTELNIDMMVMALACGLTRVATYQVGTEAHQRTLSWLGITRGLHDLSHVTYKEQDSVEEDIAIQTEFIALSRWYIENFARLLDRMREFDLLGSSLCMHQVTMNTGNHASVSVPTVLAGGGGRLRTGRHIRLENSAQYINDLLVTIGRQFGLALDVMGVPEWNLRGELSELLA